MSGGSTVLKTVIGPRLTGIEEEGDPAADAALLEVIIERPEQRLGLRPSWRGFGEPWEIGGIGAWKPVGRTVVTLSSFLRSCVAGNVTLIATLFAPDEFVLNASPVGAELRGALSSWATTESEVAKAVLYRLRRAERVCFEKRGEGAPDSWNRVARVLTEAEMAAELLHEERITLPISEPSRSWIESVAEGAASVAEVRERLADLINRVEMAPIRFTTPPPDLSLEQWMLRAYLDAWSTWRPLALE